MSDHTQRDSSALRRVARNALDMIRARPRARRVHLTSEAFRGGNYLYLWQWAFIEQRAGHRANVRSEPTMSDWTGEFPLLDPLTIDRSAISLLDARVLWPHSSFDADFDRFENSDFCQALIDSSITFRRRLAAAEKYVLPSTCVINVRRGDYYSNSDFAPRFGLDVKHHVRESLELLRAKGRAVSDILLVSDDPAWCETELSDLVAAPMRTVPSRTSMFDDLAALAASRTLVLANSTFSYWGSYLAASQHPDHLAVAPSHHEITESGERVSPMFDPHWPRTSYHPFIP